jgi:uncharacterized SAM-binding protein YcdF (DUF218 family)
LSAFALVKILTQLFYPLCIALALMAIALVQLARRRLPAGRRLLVAALLVLVPPSLPACGFPLLSWLESRYPPVVPESTPSAGAIVLLGGAISPRHPPLDWTDLNGAVDRIFHAARLWRAGKAPIVVSSGGGGPYIGGPQTPSEAMADILVELGVSRDAIVLEKQSRNTYENALYSKRLLDERGIRDVLVVTSASHMLRALSVFRSLGLQAIPAPTDFETGGAIDYTWPSVWIPDAGALAETGVAVKEYLGIAVYMARGWIHLDALQSALRGSSE